MQARASRPTSAARHGWRDDWSDSFGRTWAFDLAMMGIVVFCFGAVQPLIDPDLPLHLAVGEWIVRHHAVPFVEPFAWTTPGQPYFAYSWLLQTSYYLILRSFGHLGLRVLQGLIVTSSALSMLILARAARWRASQGVILAAVNLIIGSFFVAYLRPQSILLVTMPLTWAGFLFLLRGQRSLGISLIFGASVVTANSHLFFPMTIAPAGLLWARHNPELRMRHAVLGAIAVVAGWMCSPYSLHWIAVFRHNFGENLLYRPPSAITELQPGFVMALRPLQPLIALVMAMLLLPWVLGRVELRTRERVLYALYWSGGLILFGYAGRMFVAWWLLSLMPVGIVLAYLTSTTDEGPPRARFRVLLLAAAVAVVATQATRMHSRTRLEGDTVRRTLPTVDARPAEALAAWLTDHTVAGSRAKIVTTFSFGSYLTWRLPGFSSSIDSRGVVPDSVSAPDALITGASRDVPLGPWRSADLAVIPLRYRLAGVLDTASGWRRLAAARDESIPTDSVGLWATKTWWRQHARVADAAEPR
jgi:hypothetical protein